MASAMAATRFMVPTSCTRMMFAPFRMARGHRCGSSLDPLPGV